MTYTYAILRVSQQTYDEIHRLLDKAGYQHQLKEHDGQGLIDMHGLALQADPPDDCPESLEGWRCSAGFAPRQ